MPLPRACRASLRSSRAFIAARRSRADGCTGTRSRSARISAAAVAAPVCGGRSMTTRSASADRTRRIQASAPASSSSGRASHVKGRPAPRCGQIAAPPARRQSSPLATATPAPPPTPGPGRAAPCCAPRPPRAPPPDRWRQLRISTSGSLAHVASTPSRLASRSSLAPIAKGSRTPPSCRATTTPTGVANFKSESVPDIPRIPLADRSGCR